MATPDWGLTAIRTRRECRERGGGRRRPFQAAGSASADPGRARRAQRGRFTAAIPSSCDAAVTPCQTPISVKGERCRIRAFSSTRQSHTVEAVFGVCAHESVHTHKQPQVRALEPRCLTPVFFSARESCVLPSRPRRRRLAGDMARELVGGEDDCPPRDVLRAAHLAAPSRETAATRSGRRGRASSATPSSRARSRSRGRAAQCARSRSSGRGGRRGSPTSPPRSRRALARRRRRPSTRRGRGSRAPTARPRGGTRGRRGRSQQVREQCLLPAPAGSHGEVLARPGAGDRDADVDHAQSSLGLCEQAVDLGLHRQVRLRDRRAVEFPRAPARAPRPGGNGRGHARPRPRTHARRPMIPPDAPVTSTPVPEARRRCGVGYSGARPRHLRHGGHRRDREVGADDRRRAALRGGPQALHPGDQRGRARREGGGSGDDRRHGLPRRGKGGPSTRSSRRTSTPRASTSSRTRGRVHRAPRAGLRRGALRRNAFGAPAPHRAS